MAKSIETLDLARGESLTLQAEGSVELSVRVGVDKTGALFITGPMNHRVQTLVLTTRGFKPVVATKKRPRKPNAGT